MKHFPTDIQFKYNWRKYQQRVLDELEAHMEDGHLHVVAPPGSGKTVLGLEVMLRLNKPALILAPTLAIRNQWIQRFCELFLQIDEIPEWISRDIRNPKFITVSTYQGLHAACSSSKIEDDDFEEEETNSEIIESNANSNLETIVKGLQKQNVGVIIVDEAHHLKNEWWQTLNKIKDRLNPKVVGLTATPPYDVTPAEWNRYISLNGPVDTEISVPELIAEGDLCPHQDCVYFTLPTDFENQKISGFREDAEKIFKEISVDKTLIQAIENHPVWVNPDQNLDWIYENISSYSACLIFLNCNKHIIPKSHLEVIGGKDFEIPFLNYQWLKVLLDFYLFREKEYFEEFNEHKHQIESKLRKAGVLERNHINFYQSQKISGYLASSINKLNGINEIAEFEYSHLGKELRMVILSDYIRKEFLINSENNDLELNKLGVIPIFEKLRRENKNHKKLGVLTGSIVIIPKSAFPSFEEKSKVYGIAEIQFSSLSFDENYILISMNEQMKHNIVHIVTQIFQNGEIEILIGTKSLLGEGWDAPAINALILASFVGSFVMSNQMRGRAIRTQKDNPAKTSNIWHIVSLDPTDEFSGTDLELLKRRFRSFVGISLYENPTIENGIGRLNLPDNSELIQKIEEVNANILVQASSRNELHDRWKQALKTGVSLVEEIKIPFSEDLEYNKVKGMYHRKTIVNLMVSVGIAASWYMENAFEIFVRLVRNVKTLQDLNILLGLVVTGGILFFGRRAYRAFRLYVQYRDISKDIHQIGEALKNSLIRCGSLHTETSKIKVITSQDEHGAVFCHLEGGSTYDKSVFTNALYEIVSPIDNPRYIIVRKSRFKGFIKQTDYHAVPEILGRKKNRAEYFATQWGSLVGNYFLVYTRTIEGRKLILKSRLNALSAQFDNRIERLNKWTN
ncbi:DEAD/DEAH box helicase family protein [Moheibacter sediminis]|uniref:Helicase conserved C-terminal domain-containing protein n=1 Tax=Moheibacter sediminis TaxID=1434700 RepID=A0A1W2BUH8_9FLAO|nr:DEAD/DEAH box helicase family protein [Moheibacter sediminis]SMC76640.1 Helicase conserved C-terminal domain-containing protein [Moheibacter sediminis]